jgi:hypothetical protein
VGATVTVTNHDGDQVFTATGEFTKDEALAKAFDEIASESKRHNTTFTLNPEATDSEATTTWSVGYTPDGGEEETYPVSFPDPDAGTYSEDELEYVTVTSSIPVWEGDKPLRICINGWDGDQLDKSLASFCTDRVAELPHELLQILFAMELEPIFRIERMDGEVYKVGVNVSPLPAPGMGVAPGLPSMADVLAALSGDGEDDDA